MQPQPNENQVTAGYVPPQQTLTGEVPQQVMIGQQQPQMMGVHGQQVLVMEKPPNDGLITAVYVLSACSLILSPLFCGLPAFICAIIAITQNHPKGVRALIISIVCPIIGVVIAMLLFGAMAGL
ncbi:MAG: hypothetical protein MKZ56_06965 [Candidatus Thalassarchaeum sp.]|nr:hypothetical protein [Candidatus Thalassarchaeum sp.]